MPKQEKKSIIADALTDYKTIQEAAEKNAKIKLADEFPDKFQSLLKEELNNKGNSETEPYKKVEDKESTKLDESEANKENATMGKNQKETKKVVNEDRDKEFTGDIENDTPNLGKGATEKGDTFTEKTTTNKDSLANDTTLKEDFDVSDLDMDNIENAIDSAGAEDDVITMDQIEEEIDQMEKVNEANENDPFTEMASMKNKLQEMIDDIDTKVDEQRNHGGKQNYTGREKGGPTTQMIDEEDVVEQKNQGGKQNYTGREQGGPNGRMIDEFNAESPEDMDFDIDELDEAMGIAHSSSKHAAGDHLPNKDFAKGRHKRYGSVNNSQNESVSTKKLHALMEQNKKLTKKINESKKYKEAVNTLLENYKTAVGKYRNQLQEMTVFNTNLANVNNLLVNEGLALTQEDKVNIINNFKSVGTISESKEKYEKILSEMKEDKKTISESVEGKINETIVGESSKKKLNEVEEKTVYSNDKHINKMKSLIEYIEKSDKKLLK